MKKVLSTLAVVAGLTAATAASAGLVTEPIGFDGGDGPDYVNSFDGGDGPDYLNRFDGGDGPDYLVGSDAADSLVGSDAADSRKLRMKRSW